VGILNNTFAVLMNNTFAVLMVVLGLGFVIFIHELGHFLLAKWNGVKVEKFAIGFDVFNLRLFSRKVGETTYVLGALPLGGYVKMLGEDLTSNSAQGEAIADPRAYHNKPVGSRMAIISAGVLMNILFGLVCFAYVYLRGKREVPPVIGTVVAGMPAYDVGLQPGDKVVAIDGHPILRYVEIPQAVIFSPRGQALRFTVERPGEPEPITISVVPRIEERGVVQTVGLRPASDLELLEQFPFLAPAGMQGNPEEVERALKGGGTIVAAGPAGGTLQAVNSRLELDRVFIQAVDQSVELEIRRDGASAATTHVTLPPVQFVDFGMRMSAGPVVGVQAGSPADRAGLRSGDRIVSVDGRTDFDPIQLAREAYTRAIAGASITLQVERGAKAQGAELLSLTLQPRPSMPWTPDGTSDEPLDVAALGFALQVGPRVAAVTPDGPAALAGIHEGDVIHGVTLSIPRPGAAGKTADNAPPVTQKYVLEGKRSGKDEKMGSWPAVFDEIQKLPLGPVRIRLAGSDRELSLTPVPVAGWFHPQRGLQLLTLTQNLPPQSLPSALRMAWGDTLESAKSVYYTIRGLIQGTVTKDAVGGPIKIAEYAYNSAKLGPEAFLPFLGVLSINLAVVNFLPIPPLDGGQLLFLICEGVRGRPVPEKYAGPVMIAGLVFILLLFVVVNFNDIMSYFG
jgi:regulator of sigma E protease